MASNPYFLLSLVLVGLAALAVSALTLFSGFGLGTLLLPVLTLFFPVGVAVAATAIVHAANNLFKLALLRRDVASRIVWRFGVPAVAAAFVGAWLLTKLTRLTSWQLTLPGLGATTLHPVKVVMGLLIITFALFELVPALHRLRAPISWLPVGGALSGFFGGLSGHQGALRAAFLSPLGLSAAAFAATQAALACLVDGARLAVYGGSFWSGKMSGLATPRDWLLVVVATLCAFGGALIGKRLLPHVRLEWVRWLTGTLMLVIGLGLASGVI